MFIKYVDKKIIADIEGELVIHINEKLFFREQYILLLELGLELTKWIKNVKSGFIADFKYETMDYNEGPILEFIKQENDFWMIYSQWQENAVNDAIIFNDLLLAINVFLNELDGQLYTKYNFRINDYLK